jgi:hypothetical protein
MPMKVRGCNGDKVTVSHKKSKKVVEVTIPKGVETNKVLSALGPNTIVSDAVYASDGYVYHNGCRVKRWLSYVSGRLIWPPHINDIRFLYRIYSKCKSRLEELFKKRKKLLEMMKRSGITIAYCKPTHKFKKDPGGVNWWRYEISGYTYTYCWVKRPSKPLNVDWGDELYELQSKIDRSRKRLQFVSDFFHNELKNRLPDIDKPGRIVVLKIYNSKFTFISMEEKFRVSWSLLSIDKEIEEIDITPRRSKNGKSKMQN